MSSPWRRRKSPSFFPPWCLHRLFCSPRQEAFGNGFSPRVPDRLPISLPRVSSSRGDHEFLGGIGGYLGTEPLPYHQAVQYLINVLYNYATDLIYPVDVFRIQDSSPAGWWACLIVALVAVYVSVCVARAATWKGRGDNSLCKALMGYMLIWLALPLLVFVATMTFAHRSMYIPAIPFSALVAYPMVQAWRSLISLIYGERSCAAAGDEDEITSMNHDGGGLQRETSPSDSDGSKVMSSHAERVSYVTANSLSRVTIRPARVMIVALGAVFSIYILAYSPLVRKYGQWEDSARIALLVLTQLASDVRSISQDYHIEMYDLPDRIRSYENQTPHAKEVNYVRDYSIQSWLHLCYPTRSGTVVVRNRSWPWTFSGSLSVGFVRINRRNLVAFVELVPKSTRTSVATR